MGLQKIVSGGQTGVDRGALKAALAAGFPCGGWCPPGRLAEDGTIPHEFPVEPLDAGGYRERTLRNVLDSNGTAILYFSTPTGGTEQTLWFCLEHGKPYQLIDAAEIAPERAAVILKWFVQDKDIRILNVAGPRLSEHPLAEAYAEKVVGLLIAPATINNTKKGGG